MKKWFFPLIVLLILDVFAVKGQHTMDAARKYAAQVQQWDTSALTLLSFGSGEIELGNSKGAVLRYRADSSGAPVPYHFGIAGQLFEYEQGYLTRVSTFGTDGVLLGSAESDSIAVTELVIKRKALLEKQFSRLEAKDGNIKLNDAPQRIVLARMFDHQHRLLKEAYLSTKDYWWLQNRLYRP